MKNKIIIFFTSIFLAECVIADESFETEMMLGKTHYIEHCASCHARNGKGYIPVFPPLANRPIVKGDLNKNIDIVANGKKATAMMAFGGQFNNQELANLMTYIRNAWGNNSNQVVTEQNIVSFKEAKSN